MKKYFKILFVSILFCGSFFHGVAQQDVQFTQYMFNGLAINPAYAGSQDALSLTAIGRKQWVGIDGAPNSYTFSAHTPINPHSIGVGLQVTNDRIGPFNETAIYGSGAYWIKAGKKARLSMGLQIGVNLLRADFDELLLQNPGDQLFSTNTSTSTSPNVGAGLYYYTDRLYIGLSTPRIVRNELDLGDGDADNFQRARHFFLSSGYVFNINPNWKFKPNVLIKYVEGSPVQADINANFLFIERLWLGVSWRSFDSFDFLAQFYITPQLSVGYAYDLTTTRLSEVNSGSHELMVNYLLKFKHDRILTTRYF